MIPTYKNDIIKIFDKLNTNPCNQLHLDIQLFILKLNTYTLILYKFNINIWQLEFIKYLTETENTNIGKLKGLKLLKRMFKGLF